MLKELEAMEMGHIEVIENIRRGFQPTKSPGAEPQISNISAPTSKPRSQLSEHPHKAMKREENSFKLYSEMSLRFPDSEISTLFRKLASDEAKHKLPFERLYDDWISSGSETRPRYLAELRFHRALNSGRVLYSACFDISITSETLMPQVDAALTFCGSPADISAVYWPTGPALSPDCASGWPAKGIAFGLKIARLFHPAIGSPVPLPLRPESPGRAGRENARSLCRALR